MNEMFYRQSALDCIANGLLKITETACIFTVLPDPYQ